MSNKLTLILSTRGIMLYRISPQCAITAAIQQIG